MAVLSILICLLLGGSLVFVLKRNISLLEFLGLSFPIGIFMQTVGLIILDSISIPLTQTSILGYDILVLVGIAYALYKQKVVLPDFSSFFAMIKKQLKSLNIVWLGVFGFIAYLEYLNFSKCMFFPTYDTDSLSGFDTIGYVISREHVFKSLSIFNVDYNPNIYGPGSYISYAPLVQLSYAFVYIFGAATSKIVPAMFYLSFIVVFYGILTKIIKKTGAALITLMLLIVPEMVAFSSLSGTNVIHAVYASLGFIYGVLWFKSEGNNYLWISALLLAANNWTRSEGVIFIIIIGILVLIKAIKFREYKTLLKFSILSLIPFLGWILFQKINGLTSASILITHLFWDKDKMFLIWKLLSRHFVNTQYFGWTFYALFLAFILDVWFVIRKRDNLVILLSLIGSVVLYTMVLYHINYLWDSIENVLNYSSKRFVFCFVPIAWFYAATTKPVKYLFIKADELMTF